MLKPRNDYVAIKRDAPEKVSPGGIALVLPVDAAEEPAYGTVLAVGPGKRNKRGELVPLEVQVGQRVLIGHYVGITVKIDGADIVLMKEEEIAWVEP